MPAARRRSTRAELDALDDAIITAVELEQPITLRGVFYRAVAAGAVEKDETTGYLRVQRELLKLRRAGVIPYDWITDGSRWVLKPRSYADVEAMLRADQQSYRRALWQNQSVEVQLYSEKDAITSVVQPVTDEWDVPLGITRGISSETFCWEVAQSIMAASKPEMFIYQLGDHDTSGLTAWRAFRDRVLDFARADARRSVTVTFERLAVTEEQIASMNLPTRPDKQHGFRAVEVDAIPPTGLRRIVREAIEQHIDPRQLEIHRAVEETQRQGLAAMIRREFPDDR